MTRKGYSCYMRMFDIMFDVVDCVRLCRLSIIVIILWTVLSLGEVTNELLYSDYIPNYTAIGQNTTRNFHIPRSIGYNFLETSTAENFHMESDIKILPAFTEYTLMSNSTVEERTFTCTGNEPVQWYFKQYDDNIFKKNSLSAEVFSEERNSTIYLTILTLIRVNYLDTGRYYCAPLAVKEELIEKFENSSIYIFIKDDIHLIASPNDFDSWFLPGDNDTFSLIPCRPTSPDVDVQLFNSDGYNVTNDYDYEKYNGFFYKDGNITYINILFTCITKRNGIIEKRNFIGSSKDILTIRDEYTQQSVVENKLTLTCFTNKTMLLSSSYVLSWFISKQLNNQPYRVHFDRPKFTESPVDVIQLNIQNVTFEDNGKIICRVFYIDILYPVLRVHYQTYNLKLIPPSGNYLKVNALNDNDIIMRPVGYHSVKWTIQVLSIPNAIFEWIGPNNKKLEAISEKIRINTFNGSSELVIRNLEVSDSGVYRLSASNTFEKKDINFTLLVEDIQISPHLAEHILTINSTEADRTLICKSNKPVQWHFQDYEGNLIQKKSSFSPIFSEDHNNFAHHMSFLSLSKATYMDTGYYYCSPVSVEPKFIKDFKNIYVFVQDETHLFAIPEDVDPMQKTAINLLLPCRPTSPDINITLFLVDDDWTSSIEYDNKEGFIFKNHLTPNYTCIAEKNNMSERRHFIIPPKVLISISNENSDYVIAGQDVILYCVLQPTIFFPYLEWIINDKIKNKSNRIKYEKYDETLNVNADSRYIKLNIQNVTTEDEGFYTCEAIYGNDQLNTTYELKVHLPDETHLSLDINNNKKTLRRPVGYHSVHWKIQVIAQPKAILEWRDPVGNKLKTDSEKIFVKNDNRSSKLTIRDLELSDSGNYTLIAYNEAGPKEINVTLFVEEKPSVLCVHCLNSKDLYYEMGKEFSFEFIISGYPLPNVEWALTNCSNDTTECEPSYEQPTVKTENISLIAQKLNMTMNIKESSTLICKAWNTLGESIKHYKIWKSDEYKGFEIKGPSKIVAGDDITLICGASKYNYFNNITWIYPNEIFFINDDINITENSTEFTNLSYLRIHNISNYGNGSISCMVHRKTLCIEGVSESETRTFPIKVEEPYAPIMNNLSKNIAWKITGKLVELWCIAFGNPQPTIQWLKNNRPILFDNNRTEIKNQNQTLVIYFTTSKDEGIYTCIANNKIGNATLIFNFKEDTRIVDILFCCMLTIFLVVIVKGQILMFITERKIKKKLALNHENYFEKGMMKSWNFQLGIEEQAHLLPYDTRWEFPRNKLELGEQIGSGAFGIVYKAKATGILDDNTVTTVAIKTVRPTTDPCHRIALASELKIMTHLGRHLNVVNLLGACTSSNISKKLMVIVEYCCFGSIDRYMQTHRTEFINLVTPDGLIDHDNEILLITKISSDGEFNANEVGSKIHLDHRRDSKNIDRKWFSTKDLLCWSFQISSGMKFLASKKILHCDLASRNILLAEENIIKICDFGLAKKLYKKEIYEKSKKALLPVKWCAIESIRDGTFSTASDVWSFGVVLWEVFSLAAVPYPNIQIDDLLDRLVQGYRMEQPNYSNSQIYNIMLDCWKSEPTERPSFTDLANRLGDLLQDCTKTHYSQLNENCMKILNERLPSNDVSTLLSTTRHSNNSLIAPDSPKETRQQK